MKADTPHDLPHGLTLSVHPSLGDADTRRAFLATTRSVIDPGGQTVTAQDYLRLDFDVPTLVVWGTRDWMIPAWHATLAEKSLPGSGWSCSRGPGTSPTWTSPSDSPSWSAT